ncbi:endolytic transglycosylase MltG [candidate division KSB1 bacterium]|nr:endolytic transglycosylase MltG [candidate division KSB1 bacterium]
MFSIAAAYAGYRLFWQPQTPATQQAIEVLVPKGSGISQIASILEKNGVVRNASALAMAARLSGYDRQLQAGKFSIPAGKSNLDILRLLRSGQQVHRKITVPEGLTARQVASLLASEVDLDSAKFMQSINDSTIAQQLGVPAKRLEGYLFPETYNLPYGMTEKEIITVMVQQFNSQRPNSFNQKAKQIGLSAQQVITLASIIEGEAMIDSERTVISAVYHNRLRKGMRLQADPTIQYIIPDGPRRLLNADLTIDSPYNTYKYAGLPPGPINNPGKKSIEAALSPANVPYLYMVARGDGSHVFSRTLAEHNRAHQAFNRYRREVARQKKNQSRGGADANK